MLQENCEKKHIKTAQQLVKTHNNNNKKKKKAGTECMLQPTWGDGGAVLVGVAPTYGPNTVRVGVGVCVQAGGADDRGSLAQWGDGGGSWGRGVRKTLWVGLAVPL